MKWHSEEELITFDDVLIRPAYSELDSRFDVDLGVKIRTKHLMDRVYPIISANMVDIATPEMLSKLDSLGCIAPAHRNQSIENEIKSVENLDTRALSIGLNERDRSEACMEVAEILFLELAHADSKRAIEEVKWIRQKFDYCLVVGNIGTAEACERLYDNGVDVCKCGIGPGGACSTRLVTGVGIPQLAAVIECAEVAKKYKKYLIADGGVRGSGDCVKALAAGAHFVMIGSLLAGTDESAGHGTHSRPYRGMASRDVQVGKHGRLKKGIAPEGISTEVPYKGPVENVIESLLAGIRQGMSMVGARTLYELREKVVFQRVSNSTVLENVPHILSF